PLDTVVSCAVDLDEFGVAGATARLINTGVYPSSDPGSTTADLVLLPECTANADCASGQVCHLASGECYAPAGCTSNADCGGNTSCNAGAHQCLPGGCTSDADCVAGKTCNVATGQCGAPSVDVTGCASNSDCATGLSCDVASGVCES